MLWDVLFLYKDVQDREHDPSGLSVPQDVQRAQARGDCLETITAGVHLNILNLSAGEWGVSFHRTRRWALCGAGVCHVMEIVFISGLLHDDLPWLCMHLVSQHWRLQKRLRKGSKL